MKKVFQKQQTGALKRDVSGRWALGVGRPPVPRVDTLCWKASNGSLVPWAQWDKGTVPKSLGWGLSTCHPFTLPQTHSHHHFFLISNCTETKCPQRNTGQNMPFLNGHSQWHSRYTIIMSSNRCGGGGPFWLVLERSSCSVISKYKA